MRAYRRRPRDRSGATSAESVERRRARDRVAETGDVPVGQQSQQARSLRWHDDATYAACPAGAGGSLRARGGNACAMVQRGTADRRGTANRVWFETKRRN
jgi:hypothetical protein